MKTLLIERETYEKNEKTYFSYCIKGEVRGKAVKVGLCPPDKGGYAVLDIVFGESDNAKLMINPFEIKDEMTGKIITGNSYTAQNIDEEGEIFESAIKPARSSDKSILKMLLK